MACAAAAPSPAGAYASASFGSGNIYGGNAGSDRGMRNRALELRFGPELPVVLTGASVRLDFIHVNEGHPENNHRDGFGAQLVYARRLGNRVTAEVAAGPYLSMNTTVIDHTQIDDANLGLLTGVALRFPLDGWLPGWHVRAGVNHVTMRDVHDSTTWLLGAGRAFGKVPADTAPPGRDAQAWFGGSVGTSITNLDGTRDAVGWAVTARRSRGTWAASGMLIFEGDDRTKVDRRGVAAQGWFVQPLTPRWALAAGAGPYFAENERDHDKARLHALITMAAEYAVDERTHLTISFSRVKTFREKSDRDLFHVGILQAFHR